MVSSYPAEFFNYSPRPFLGGEQTYGHWSVPRGYLCLVADMDVYIQRKSRLLANGKLINAFSYGLHGKT